MIIVDFQRLAYEPEEMSLSNPCGLNLWIEAYACRDRHSVHRLMVAYLCGETISDCLRLSAGKEVEIDNLLDWFVDSLRNEPLPDLMKDLKCRNYALAECVDNIPQLSSLEASTISIVDLLSISDTPLTYVRLGYHLYGAQGDRNEIAKRKYGENAAKFAAILGLVRLGRDIKDPTANNRIAVELTDIGRAFARAGGDRMQIVARLLLRSALFRDLVCSGFDERATTFWNVVSLLSPETRLRRTSAFSAMLGLYVRHGGVLDEGCRAEELLCRMRR